MAESSRWLRTDEQSAWRKLAAVTVLLPAALEAQLQRDADLTHFGYWVLAMLSEAPDHAMRMSELAAQTFGSQSRLSHLVARMERRGWVQRSRVSEDGRGYRAALTPAGYAKLVESAPAHAAEVAHIFDGLTPEQVAILDELCAVILRRLEAATNASPA
jgi:DNA-binding MarR family transcriptional regulator